MKENINELRQKFQKLQWLAMATLEPKKVELARELVRQKRSYNNDMDFNYELAIKKLLKILRF